jgi:hypothetical protein
MSMIGHEKISYSCLQMKQFCICRIVSVSKFSIVEKVLTCEGSVDGGGVVCIQGQCHALPLKQV